MRPSLLFISVLVYHVYVRHLLRSFARNECCLMLFPVLDVSVREICLMRYCPHNVFNLTIAKLWNMFSLGIAIL